MRNTGLYEVQTGIKLAPRNINKYKHADDTTLRTEKMEDLKVSWCKWKREWKNDLKFNIQKTKITVSGPITSWQRDRETMLDLTYFVGGWWIQITADGDCSHGIKRCFLFERKFMSNLHCLLKSRDITWPTNVCLVKAIISPVVIYECDSWTIQKDEKNKLYFWTVILEKTLEKPLDFRKCNRSILRRSVLDIHLKNCCWSWNSNTLPNWWEELTHGKRPSCWERLREGGQGDGRGWNGWMT